VTSQTIDEISARLEIQELASRYCDAVNRRAWAEVNALFSEDGEWIFTESGETVSAVGRAAIAELYAKKTAAISTVVQLAHGVRVDLQSSTEATTRWYLTEIVQDLDGNSWRYVGVYKDRLTLTVDGWRFATHRYDRLERRQESGAVTRYPFPSD
jgi:hypothetical protein